jgi:hypothetical protein
MYLERRLSLQEFTDTWIAGLDGVDGFAEEIELRIEDSLPVNYWLH